MRDTSIQRLEELFTGALAREADERESYLNRVCAGDETLKTQVRELLTSHETKDDFLRVPADSALLSGLRGAQEIEGRQIGRYTIRRVIAMGGMGVVYEAEQERPNRTVALKVMRHGLVGEAMRQRFQHEVDILGRLQHPNIARIYEAGICENESLAGEVIPFFAMEMIDGRPLTDDAQTRKFNTRERLRLMIKICQAVHHAHQKGVIHRDLKPANILVDSTGEPKVLDFGVARATESDIQMTTLQTNAGQLIGTIPYMSPEQLLGDAGGLDTRSDVYALGVLIYELLADRLPHDLENKSVAEAARIIHERETPPLGTIGAEFRGDIETIVGKSLEKDRTRRYQSVLELAADIERYLKDEPIIARPPTALYQLRKFARRNKTLVGGAVTAFALLLLAVGGTTYGLFEARREREIAEQSEQEARAINEFLHNMLSSADPSKAGYQVTVAEVLNQAAKDLETQFLDRPAIRGSLYATIGHAYGNLGLYDTCRNHLRTAVNLYKQSLGDEHPDTLMSMERLAGARVPPSETEQLLRQVRDIRSRTLGEYHPDTLRTKMLVVESLLTQGKLSEAESLFSTLLEPVKKTFGEESPIVIRTTMIMALKLRQHGRLTEAEDIMMKQLEICRRNPDKESQWTLMTMAYLGELRMQQGRLDEAEALLRFPLEVKRKVLGEEHPATNYSLTVFSQLLLEQGRFDETEPVARKAVDYSRAAYVHGDDRTLPIALRNLAELLRKQGKLKEAEPLLIEALDYAKKTLVEIHPRTLEIMCDLASLRTDQGKLEKAAEMFEQALTTKSEGLFVLARIRSEYGHCLIRLGRYNDAKRVLAAAYDAYQKALGRNHDKTKRIASRLVEVNTASGDVDEANQWQATLAEQPR